MTRWAIFSANAALSVPSSQIAGSLVRHDRVAIRRADPADGVDKAEAPEVPAAAGAPHRPRRPPDGGGGGVRRGLNRVIKPEGRVFSPNPADGSPSTVNDRMLSAVEPTTRMVGSEGLMTWAPIRGD